MRVISKAAERLQGSSTTADFRDSLSEGRRPPSRFPRFQMSGDTEGLTVGELMLLTKFYKREGASITAKMGHYMGEMIPRMLAILQDQNPALFNDY